MNDDKNDPLTEIEKQFLDEQLLLVEQEEEKKELTWLEKYQILNTKCDEVIAKIKARRSI